MMWTETAIIEPDRYLARQEVKAGVKAWTYYFSYMPASLRTVAPGTPHGGEIGYVFETLPATAMKRGGFEIPAANGEDRALAAHIHAYWVAFAKTGDPDSAGGPEWPAYTPANDAAIEFGVDGVQVHDQFKKQQLDIIESIAARK